SGIRSASTPRRCGPVIRSRDGAKRNPGNHTKNPGLRFAPSGLQASTMKIGEKSMQRLKGKTAVVVGAGSIGPGWGNGKATAVTFAREGAQVFCVDRNGAAAAEPVKIIAGEGGQAAAF